jgi:hypothetical protein
MNVKSYKKKPVVIQALQWDGKNQFEVMSFCKTCYFTSHGTVKDLYIDTLEGDMLVKSGDYIIKGVKGEFYPCKPEIFEMTYETVI